MKLRLIAICLVLNGLGVKGQTINNHPSYFIEAYDAKGRPFTSQATRDIKGTPLFTDSWAQGNVIFTNRRAIRQIELKFNIEKNELYFKKDDLVLLFVDPVLEFSFAYDSVGEKHFAYFKAGYPKDGLRTDETFYQVLASGRNLEFLKFPKKTVIEEFQYNASPTKSFTLSEDYYIYDIKSKELIQIKLKMSSVTKALPAYSKSIDKFAEEKGFKLRSEQEMEELIKFLNQ